MPPSASPSRSPSANTKREREKSAHHALCAKRPRRGIFQSVDFGFAEGFRDLFFGPFASGAFSYVSLSRRAARSLCVLAWRADVSASIMPFAILVTLSALVSDAVGRKTVFLFDKIFSISESTLEQVGERVAPAFHIGSNTGKNARVSSLFGWHSAGRARLFGPPRPGRRVRSCRFRPAGALWLRLRQQHRPQLAVELLQPRHAPAPRFSLSHVPHAVRPSPWLLPDALPLVRGGSVPRLPSRPDGPEGGLPSIPRRHCGDRQDRCLCCFSNWGPLRVLSVQMPSFPGTHQKAARPNRYASAIPLPSRHSVAVTSSSHERVRSNWSSLRQRGVGQGRATEPSQSRSQPARVRFMNSGGPIQCTDIKYCLAGTRIQSRLLHSNAEALAKRMCGTDCHEKGRPKTPCSKLV